MALGEELSCPDLEMVAVQNAKLIGLAILEYLQDHGEMYPDGAAFSGAILPYMDDRNMLTVGSVSFQYTPPASLKLTDVASPATTAIGRFSFPCAEVVLYAGGHVKWK
ncbi:MAG: hypothetical protein ACLQVD_09845 [Capsulimonadaceae bacterium]